MKSFIAALLAASVSAGAAVKGTKVCVSNFAGFDLHFHMTDLNTGASSAESDNYPIDKTKCMDI